MAQDAKYQVMGMDLELVDDPDYTVSPLGAIVVIKGFDSNGDIVHTLATTGDISSVEGLGMLHFGVLFAEDKVRQSIVNAGPSETEFASGEAEE